MQLIAGFTKILKIDGKQHKSADISLKLRLVPVVFHKILYWVLCFFVIHKWDLPYAYNQLNFFLFADDTNLLYADKSLRSLEVTVTTEFTSDGDWLMTKKYYLLNTKESSFVTRPYQKQTNFDIAIKLFDYDKNYSREGTC